MGSRNKNNKVFVIDGVAASRGEVALERIEDDIDRAAKRQKRYLASWKFNANEKFECQLLRGGCVFPRKEILSQIEMRTRNKKLRRQYIHLINNGVESSLWEWKVVDLKDFYKRKNWAVSGRA